jgi:mitochondrial fission protein ELM1
MTRPDTKPVWVVSDGRAGIEAPALGLAEALGLPFDRRHLNWSRLTNVAEATLPFWAFRPFMPDLEGLSPTLAIGAGRLAAPMLRKLRQDGTKTVFLGNPRTDPGHFDLVIAPAHDGLAGPNVLTTIGSLHRVTPARLTEAAREWGPKLAHLPHPRLAVLIGGTSKRHDLPDEKATGIAESLSALATAGFGLMMTVSRRTPAPARQILIDRLKNHANVAIFDGEGDNPYFGYLALADGILVTNDSVNMASEACATGKCVYLIDLPGKLGKLATFYRQLQDRDLARPFTGTIELWSPTSMLDDMALSCQHVTEMLEGRSS